MKHGLKEATRLMNRIITLTLNPVIDKNTMVTGFRPNEALQCSAPIYFAGGGGINVSRALKNLGGSSTAIYAAGGRTGKHLENLLNDESVQQKIIPLENTTRENLSVTDRDTQLQYRFGMPGPFVKEMEWSSILDVIEKNVGQGDYLVASGKLAPGIPDDFYLKISAIVNKNKAKLILDTKGIALQQVVDGEIFLLKPNLPEFCALCGVDSVSFLTLEDLAQTFIETHSCKILVVSLGVRGALLVTKKMMGYVPAPVVQQKSKIGAGDSMVAGMVFSLTKDRSLTEMVEYGVACGAAATMRTGTQLCKKEDVNLIYKWISSNALKSKTFRY